MTAVLLVIVLLTVAFGVGWFFWPEIGHDLEMARRKRQIDAVKARTLAAMEREREIAWFQRERQSRDRLDRIIDELDL